MKIADKRAIGLGVGILATVTLLLSLVNLVNEFNIWRSYGLLTVPLLGTSAGVIGSIGGIFWARSLMRVEVITPESARRTLWFYLLGIVIGGIAIGLLVLKTKVR